MKIILAYIKTLISGTKETILPYKKRDYLLTIAERNFYDALIKIATELNLIVFCKVRLEDLLWLPKGLERGQRWGLRGRVKSRHIDFVLCNKENIRPLLAIELDDSSHYRLDRIERDSKVNLILESAKLPILHIKVQKNYNLETIRSQIKSEAGLL